jgi:folate-binding protein YgfZ
MTIPSPLQNALEQFEVEYAVQHDLPRDGAATGHFTTQLLSEFLPWGEDGCFVLATTGIVELEYAAIQKAVAVFDASCRGTIELTGDDRLECINRLSTQQLLDMKAGESRLSFVTSRKGATLADVIVHVLSDRILLDLDCTVVKQVVDHMNAYVVMEDVVVQDVSDTTHWLWLLGPESKNHIPSEGDSSELPKDFLGIEGFAIAFTPSVVIEEWKKIVKQGARPIGWYALNMARVEQGRPLFMIDFDSKNLPHETSLIQSRVRFDKGCYLGQEIVARMESLGKPKQRLVQLRMQDDNLPISGAQLWKDETGSGTPIGAVTSSAISPLRGGIPTVIAMVSKSNAIVASTIYMYIGEELVKAEIEELSSLQKEETS